MVFCQGSQAVPEIGKQFSCIINAQLWCLKRGKGRGGKSEKGYLFIPFIFYKCPMLSGSDAQILFHQIPWDHQGFCGEGKLIVSGVIE